MRSSINKVLRDEGSILLGYGDSRGYLPLREYIAKRLRNHEISTHARDVLITNGSQQAIELVFRMLSKPGGTVVIETPTYDHVLPLIKYYGLRPIEIPLKGEGMDLEILEEKLKEETAVHGRTKEILNSYNIHGVSDVLKFYDNWFTKDVLV